MLSTSNQILLIPFTVLVTLGSLHHADGDTCKVDYGVAMTNEARVGFSAGRHARTSSVHSIRHWHETTVLGCPPGATCVVNSLTMLEMKILGTEVTTPLGTGECRTHRQAFSKPCESPRHYVDGHATCIAPETNVAGYGKTGETPLSIQHGTVLDVFPGHSMWHGEPGKSEPLSESGTSTQAETKAVMKPAPKKMPPPPKPAPAPAPVERAPSPEGILKRATDKQKKAVKPKLGFADEVEVKEFDKKEKVEDLRDTGVYTKAIKDEEEDDDDDDEEEEEEEWGKDDE
ncbi:unnamed protein product [Vitrella brassicaformis CCMP3155]|uniref:Uncharacterized protein n=1 Tax=Vitrella brassicaformis (strain CCMP3155) TaxID=1169540 RepID=A0A0G4EPQ9_VITBC|nr:unnamed protein product [Vitrella brassicaformis CCMP3155]|eukprot:CEL99453.1 unnamed protein product [Vitrella brassicaformis CCMP3155]